MAHSPFKWGILSTGKIAHDFVTALKHIDGVEVVAVGSRTIERAQEFITNHSFTNAKAYGTYEELVADDNINAIYIASPHGHHYEHLLLCLNAGKNVLCEKAFTLNASQAEIVVRLAREKQVFLMEAMWTRFLPLIRSLITEQLPRIGDVRMVTADFGFVDPGVQRLSDLSLGGGALLDIGIYALTIASIAYQDATPTSVYAKGSTLASGADEQVVVTLTFGERQLASVYCTIGAATPSEALIIGTKGWIRIHFPFWTPTKMTVCVNNVEEVLTFPHPEPREGHSFNFLNSIGMRFEAQHVQQCIAEGRKESPIISLDLTLQMMHLMDQIRSQVGVKYLCE